MNLITLFLHVNFFRANCPTKTHRCFRALKFGNRCFYIKFAYRRILRLCNRNVFGQVRQYASGKKIGLSRLMSNATFEVHALTKNKQQQKSSSNSIGGRDNSIFFHSCAWFILCAVYYTKQQTKFATWLDWFWNWKNRAWYQLGPLNQVGTYYKPVQTRLAQPVWWSRRSLKIVNSKPLNNSTVFSLICKFMQVGLKKKNVQASCWSSFEGKRN